MGTKRIIGLNATTDFESDDNIVVDSTTAGTRKMAQSVLKEKLREDCLGSIHSLTVDEIKALQGGEAIKFDFGEVGADCLMLSRIVPEGLAVEANQHFTVALDLKITDDLRRACVARELVNRIQNRRKDQDFAISDRITIELYSESEVLKLAVKENENYIKGETQANAIIWKDSTAGLQESDADGEKVFVEAVR